jgi:MFS family permease
MTAQPTPKGAWKITFLLFLFMLVNFADKIVVGLAGVPIMTEMKLEPEQFGLLGSSFFFLFSISAIVVGFIVNRIATRWYCWRSPRYGRWRSSRWWARSVSPRC